MRSVFSTKFDTPYYTMHLCTSFVLVFRIACIQYYWAPSVIFMINYRWNDNLHIPRSRVTIVFARKIPLNLHKSFSKICINQSICQRMGKVFIRVTYWNLAGSIQKLLHISWGETSLHTIHITFRWGMLSV